MPAGTQWIGFQTSREILERHQLKLPARSETVFHSRFSPESLQLSQSLMALVTMQFTCQQSKPKNGLLLGDELIAGFRQAIDASRDANQRLHRPYNHVRGTLLKKFEEAIDGHLKSDLRIPDLCGHVGVGQRTLESFCNDYYGMSPKRYLSVRRLNAVRDCLLRGALSDLSIAELAGTFRFTHPGRFSKIYWSHFGELPSHSLRHR
jgi:AraC-like DNA-binding protein